MVTVVYCRFGLPCMYDGGRFLAGYPSLQPYVLSEPSFIFFPVVLRHPGLSSSFRFHLSVLGEG